MPDNVRCVPKWLQGLFGVYLILMCIVLVYVLIRVWPAGTGDVRTMALLPGNRLTFSVALEVQYLAVVVVAEALGSFVHVATSFADFVGNRQFAPSWILWYILRPFIGVALALLLYFVVRAGLVQGNGGASNVSIHGVAAIAGLAGMFSKQAGRQTA